MSIHPMAALHARGMPAWDALTIALLDSPAQLRLDMPGSTPGDYDSRALWEACRAMLYPCGICETAKPVSEYSRDSHGCGGICEACYDAAGLENAHSDGYHVDEPDPDCPDCRAIAA